MPHEIGDTEYRLWPARRRPKHEQGSLSRQNDLGSTVAHRDAPAESL